MANIWIKNATIVTATDDQPILTGHLIVQGDRITHIGTELPDWHHTVSFDDIIDTPNRLYMPGLVNTHTHAAMSYLRGFADDMALQTWLEDYMWPNEAKFTSDDVYWGAQLSVVEMIKSGTTSFLDMYDHMDRVAEVVQASGLRACLTRGMIGFGPDDVLKQKLADAKAFASTWQGQANGRITTMIAPHAPYTCPPAFITKAIEISAELNIPMHTHMSETAREVADNVAQYGERPVKHLQKLGFFDRPSIVAHAVHLTDEEIAILAAHDVRVAHNPGSNLKLASGIARVPDLLQAGVKVGLATDSSASNNNLDMFEEMNLAALLHKGTSQDPTVVPAQTALQMATKMGAETIWLDGVGTLAVGQKADFIAIDIDQPHYYPRTNLISHLAYSGGGQDVTDMWVDGARIMKNKEILTIDEAHTKAEVQRRYEALMNR
jgi:5-methylthioadenosine/S-adenosylhomocysteine deaminase